MTNSNSDYRFALIACTSLVFVPVIYEPLRGWILEYIFDQEVGGVGGVGGLCNLWKPVDSCTTTAGGAEGPYCFQKGMLFGFTPFALAVLLAWTLPLGVVSFLHYRWGAPRATDNREMNLIAADSRRQEFIRHSPEFDNTSTIPPNSVASCSVMQVQIQAWFRLFQASWIGISALWLALPLWQFESSEFFARDFWHRFLGFAIAAAFPLSWHVALVAILSFSAAISSRLQSRYHSFVMKMHKFVAWNTVVWGLLHGGGELVWIISQNEVGLIFDIRKGENIVYLTGFLSFLLLVMIAILSLVRTTPQFRPLFKAFHKKITILFLITATAHWWPFAIFLVPTVALAAMITWASPVDIDTLQRVFGKAFSISVLGSLIGVSLVWQARELVMGRRDADIFFPFIFSPLALVGGCVSAWVCLRFFVA